MKLDGPKDLNWTVRESKRSKGLKLDGLLNENWTV